MSWHFSLGLEGGILGGVLLGWHTVCAVELDAYCARRLMQRQNEGHLPPFPIWDDVRSFDGRPWRGLVDVVSGGFPCQDISAAGKGAGINGARSGLWGEMARIIDEVRPRFVFVENSPLLVRRGLTRVLGDLASIGFDARWGVLGADDVGAPHRRKRIWILANTQGICEREPADKTDPIAIVGKTRHEPVCCGQHLGHPDRLRELQPQGGEQDQRGWPGDSGWWESEPDVGRMVNGLAFRVDRLRAIGNGQVPAVAAAAWRLLSQ